jgi:hypothetical protein
VPASAHPTVVASAVSLTVVPEQLPQLPERCLDERQGVLALDIADIPNPQHLVQPVRGHLQRPWGGRRARRWLWVCRGQRRVKGDLPLDLLQNLMDVTVQHGDRAEAFHQGQCLLAILGDPPPLEGVQLTV